MEKLIFLRAPKRPSEQRYTEHVSPEARFALEKILLELGQGSDTPSRLEVLSRMILFAAEHAEVRDFKDLDETYINQIKGEQRL